MTKLIAILTAILVVALSLTNVTAVDTAVVTAVDTAPDIALTELAGIVTEATPDYLLIQTLEGQEIQVNTAQHTHYEGDTPAVGDLIHISYDGKMTRSLPPQIFAVCIGCYTRTGAVVELTQDGFTLDTGDDIIQVIADAALLTDLESGMQVKVYFNGAMTMSLPAQIGAELIVAQ